MSVNGVVVVVSAAADVVSSVAETFECECVVSLRVTLSGDNEGGRGVSGHETSQDRIKMDVRLPHSCLKCLWQKSTVHCFFVDMI